jgi:hypothetical protein
MIKSDMLNGGNMFIGFSRGYAKGYCKKCQKLFDIHYNGVNPLTRDDRCPKCHKFDNVETDDFIDQHVDILKMARGLKYNDDDKKRKRIIKDINELHKIRRIFEEDKEQKEREFLESLNNIK